MATSLKIAGKELVSYDSVNDIVSINLGSDINIKNSSGNPILQESSFSTSSLTVNGLTTTENLKLTVSPQTYEFILENNNLIIKCNNTRIMKLDTSGNLTVIGNITAYGTL